MSVKILVADDSLTIQKVIGITLANSGYDLVECHNEVDLLTKIQNETFDLILLDFNLSESKTGYELSLAVKNKIPKSGLIVMLGTFDSIDDSKFSECGIDDKIVKPFESSKFIKKCKDVLENITEFTVPNIDLDKTKEIKVETKEFDLDSWVVDAPKNNSQTENLVTEDLDTNEVETLDPLSSEIKGWGFEAQLEDRFNKKFPPVIEEVDSSLILEKLESSSQFVVESNTDSFTEATDPHFEMPESLNRDLLSEIDDEVSIESFWAVDDVTPVSSVETEDIIETNFDEVTADLTDSVRIFHEKENTKSSNIELTNVDVDQLVEKLKVALAPQIEALVKAYCKEVATKVSWEVIPDLAENLIKKEIREISDSIQ